MTPRCFGGELLNHEKQSLAELWDWLMWFYLLKKKATKKTNKKHIDANHTTPVYVVPSNLRYKHGSHRPHYAQRLEEERNQGYRIESTHYVFIGIGLHVT